MHPSMHVRHHHDVPPSQNTTTLGEIISVHLTSPSRVTSSSTLEGRLDKTGPGLEVRIVLWWT